MLYNSVWIQPYPPSVGTWQKNTVAWNQIVEFLGEKIYIQNSVAHTTQKARRNASLQSKIRWNGGRMRNDSCAEVNKITIMIRMWNAKGKADREGGVSWMQKKKEICHPEVLTPHKHPHKIPLSWHPTFEAKVDSWKVSNKSGERNTTSVFELRRGGEMV